MVNDSSNVRVTSFVKMRKLKISCPLFGDFMYRFRCVYLGYKMFLYPVLGLFLYIQMGLFMLVSAGVCPMAALVVCHL